MNARVPRPNLRRARLRLGWSKERAADEISRRYPHLAIDPRQIGRWESGETAIPRPMNVLALSRTYGVPPEELDLPPLPGVDASTNVPGASESDQRGPGAVPSGRSDERVGAQVHAAGGEFITLTLNRRELIEMVGGTTTAALLPAEHEAYVLCEPLSRVERSVLTHVVGQSVEAAWSLFHTANTELMLAVGRTQMYLLRRHHGDLERSTLPALYSAAYRLVGATHHRRACYVEALRAHDQAYVMALESGDPWSMAQSRAWYGYGLQCLGRHGDSLPVFEAAIRLLSGRGDPGSSRLRARLLASAAISAATLGEAEQAAAMLGTSEMVLDQLPALHEEFDRTAWLSDAGACSLLLGHVELAIAQLQQALRETPERWTARNVFATMALVGALAQHSERDAAVAATDGLIERVDAMRSRELSDFVVGSLRNGLLATFPDDTRCRALVSEAETTLLAHA